MNELEKKVEKWILKNGYPFEMKVAQAFKSEGFHVSQSILYKDNDLNKYREIDIIAHTNKFVNGVWINLTYVVECKKSTDKPWVVFKNKDLFNLQSKRYKILGSKNSDKLISKIPEEKRKDENLKFIFPSISECGYNVVTAFKESKDLAYSASKSLLNACNYLVEKSNNSKLNFCNIYIPIIIIEGILYESFLKNDGTLNLSEVNYSTIANTKSFDESASSILTIASSLELNNFIKELRNNNDTFFDKFIKLL
jgi:hypothetical protein